MTISARLEEISTRPADAYFSLIAQDETESSKTHDIVGFCLLVLWGRTSDVAVF